MSLRNRSPSAPRPGALPFPGLLAACALAAFGGFTGTRHLCYSLSDPPAPGLQTAAENPPSPGPSTLPSDWRPEQTPRGDSFASYRRWAENAASPGDAKDAFLRAIHKLQAPELEELLLRELPERPIFWAESPEMQLAIQRLAQLDPERAAALWAGMKLATFNPVKMAELFLRPWMKRDPDAFFRWFGGLPALAQKRSSGFLEKIASEQPELLLTHAESLRGLPNLKTAVADAVQKITPVENDTGAGWKNVLERVRTLPGSGGVRDAALVQLVSQAASRNVADFPYGDPDIRVVLASMEGWPREIPDALLAHLPEGPLRSQKVRSMLRDVECKSGDESGEQALSRFQNTADYPAALLGFVEANAPRATASQAASLAARAVALPAETESGANLRLHALEVAAGALFKADPEAARAWVQEAPLSEREYFHLTGRSRSR